MDFKGKKVEHFSLGVGTIMGFDDSGKYIDILFSGDKELRRFQYPNCFEKFIHLIDEDETEEIENAIKIQQEKEAIEKEEREHLESLCHHSWESEQNLKKGKKTISVKPMSSVEEFVSTYCGKLSGEIAFLKTNGGKRQKVYEGKLIERKNGRFFYSFETEEELLYPDGTRIRIYGYNDTLQGTIDGTEDTNIYIHISHYLGEIVPVLEFSADAWTLLQGLVDRLNELQNDTSPIVKSLVCDGMKNIDFQSSRIISGQENAVSQSVSKPITFIWGPPGTGKTQTLAKIVLKHIELGHKVLMLSYSNVSVDEAILRADSLSKDNVPGVLVRYGYPRKTEIIEHDYLCSYNLAIMAHPDLMEKRDSLRAEMKKLKAERRGQQSEKRLLEIHNELATIKNKIAEEEKKKVLSAKFVATTVSKAIVDSIIYNEKFDAVIFDEASMAYIPQIVFSASLAKTNFICMGDFCQLPPIVQSDSASELNADIFQYCGIAKAVETRKNHKWLCMLDTQYRMHPEIADFASRFMYNGLLKSADSVRADREKIVNSEPFEKYPIGFLDLSGMMSVCSKTKNNSRVNPLSALITFAFALKASENNDIGIITPYHAQARLYNSMALDSVSANENKHSIVCATVHQFQGSEKDMIFFDAVDCYRMPYPGMLLTSMTNSYANRLFNVALTRSKGKFIGTANVNYMITKKLSSNLMLEKIIKKTEYESMIFGDKLIASAHNNKNDVINFYYKDEAERLFRNDLMKAEKSIYIDIPGRKFDYEELEAIEQILKNKKREGVKVFIKVENYDNIPRNHELSIDKNTFITDPVAIIDKKVVWYGEPLSSADFIIEEQEVQTLFRPIIRFSGEHTARALFGYLEMNRIYY